MPSNTNDADFDAKIQERFRQLPKVVQDAITSADVEQHLRQMAERHRLHLDQWERLENEVMLALLGFQPMDDLTKNIGREVSVDPATAAALASDISTIVFQPIREELERQLQHPDAVAKAATAVETMRADVLAEEASTATAAAAAPAPATTTPIAPVAASAPTPPQTPAAEPSTPLPNIVSTITMPPTASTAPVSAEAAAPTVPAATVAPAPTPAPVVERAAVPESYTTTASHERKTIAGDPYREQIA